MESEADPMRIAIERRPLPGYDEEPAPEVIGRNGTLNRELDDFKHLGKHATLAEYSPAQVAAYCLNDMTFHGFSEAEQREVREELQRRVAEIDAMSEEERAEKLIPAEKVFADLKAKYGIRN